MTVSVLTSNDICARVRARIAAGLPVPLIARADHNIALAIEGGCERLADVIKDSSLRALLVAEITNKTPAAGKLDLSHADYANMLIDTFKRPGAINTYAESAVVFNHAPSLDALRANTPTDPTCVWYYLRSNAQLVFKDPANGALNTYATALNLAGSYIPILGSATRPLQAELDDKLVDRVAEIVKGLGGLGFLTKDPDKAREQVER